VTTRTTYTQARANLAALWDQVTDDREVVVLQRRGAEDVALIAADELTGLMETVYLLQSPKNAERLLEALDDARRGEGIRLTLDELRAEVGLDKVE
jgi:antitoxin YefM